MMESYGHPYMELAGQLFWIGVFLLFYIKRKTWLAPSPPP